MKFYSKRKVQKIKQLLEREVFEDNSQESGENTDKKKSWIVEVLWWNMLCSEKLIQLCQLHHKTGVYKKQQMGKIQRAQ